jgi:hypothetical protein
MTTGQIYQMKQRAFCQHGARFRAIRKAAYPETGGDSLFVHNWIACSHGPESAIGDALTQGEWASWRRIDARFDRWYAAAEHRRHVAQGFRPLWCACCARLHEDEIIAEFGNQTI